MVRMRSPESLVAVLRARGAQLVALVVMVGIVGMLPQAGYASCATPANRVEAGNCLTGNPASGRDIVGAKDSSIQGFATDISVNRGGTGAFAVAAVNLGTASAITVAADTGGAALPVSLTLCETNPGTGACLQPPNASVVTAIASGATPTFAIFVQGTGAVAFNPAVNRVFVRFREGGPAGTVRGATGVAVRTF